MIIEIAVRPPPAVQVGQGRVVRAGPGPVTWSTVSGRPAKNRSRAWAGRIADSFCIDLSLLAIINGAVAIGTAPDLAKRQPEHAANSFVARQTSGTPAKLCRQSRLASDIRHHA